MTDQELIQAARAMLTRSYAPFSHYAVGAALLGSDGQVYTGCNIESAAFGATLCAERSAIANAFSHGCHSFVRGAVIADSDDTAPPAASAASCCTSSPTAWSCSAARETGATWH